MKTDWLRTSLIAGIAVICFLLVIRWNEAQQQQAPAEEEQTLASESSTPVLDAPNLNPTPSSNVVSEGEGIPSLETEQPIAVTQNQPQTDLIHVHTDVLDVLIDPVGGDIVRVALPTFYKELNNPDKPYVLLDRTPSHTYIARSGLIGRNGTDKPGDRPHFSSAKSEYQLQDGEDSLSVDLVFEQSPGVTITKRFTFTEGDHLINISYLINNQSDQAWQGAIYGQIKHDGYNPVTSAGLGMQPFFGPSTTTDESNYEKMSLEDIEDKSFEHTKIGGWVAMVQHYFFSAWIPAPEDKNAYKFYKLPKQEVYLLQFTSSLFKVDAQSQAEKTVQFYAGPKDIKRLEAVSPYLDLTVDYSFLWWIAKPLFFALDWIHSWVGNWGVAIILLTMLIKAIFFYPSATSYRSMAKMRKLAPKMKELKDRYGDDRQKFSAETMKLYKTEKVNPLSGCLPVLIQMPVFLALYWVLMESVELRHAPFILWIEDLSVKDPYFVLPLIMGASMWIQQKLNPTPPDPMQAKVMQMMPIFFTFLFLFFPSGLVLYWVVNNTLSITQQYIITKNIEKQS